ncbi:gluconolactonase [Advenella kashmirensis W13003]|uniref:Gluconolactonase n=1 Tax=Advenella kashmirensis W13003 TaxID=1424334 RepID=V8QTD5_9BURK|nr:SMP-30/gluconolactonase/LRE family protein [Advenella kashmirensis]ETF02907.1 gluconolactonase [Advenella kashmirensis W13003]
MNEHRVERLGNMICAVGESPVWHGPEQALYWTDIPAKKLWRYETESGIASQWDLPEMAGCIAMQHDGGWLAAMETGIFAMPTLTAGQTPAVQRMTTVMHARAGMRFNDGRCDRQGRFWAGTMLMDMTEGASAGQLYRYAVGEFSVPIPDSLIVPNGMAFSPDGRTMYLSDSHPSRKTVWRYDYDPDTGIPANRRTFIAALPAGRPDGAAVDQDGCYWICGNEAGTIYRYTPDGRLDRSLSVPVPRIAMCAFGGRNLDTLFVTSIRGAGAGPDALDGAIFALRPGTCGLEEPACRA